MHEYILDRKLDMMKIAPWRTVSVFVTSTFRDMHAERDHLRLVVFPELAERLRKRMHHLEVVDLRWGVETVSLQDEAAKDREVLRVCLDEIERCRPFQIVVLGERYGYVIPNDSLKTIANQLQCGPNALANASVTAVEIECGLFAPWAGDQRAYVYCRDPLPIEQLSPDALARYTDRRPGQDADRNPQEKLKARIFEALPARFRPYTAAWNADTEAVEGLAAFGAQVLDDLWSELDAYTAAFARKGPRSVEEQQRFDIAEEFARSFRGFVGRDDLLAQLVSFATGDSDIWGICLTGAAGSGKTSMLAALGQVLQDNNSTILLNHAAGAAVDGGAVNTLLRRWIGELAQLDGVAIPTLDRATSERLEELFAYHLSMAAERRRVVILVDALDQLEPTARARNMAWLVKAWPKNARLIASAIPGEHSHALTSRDGCDDRPIPPLTPGEGRAIANRLCHLEHRRLNDRVLERLLVGRTDGSEPAAANPLWLTLAVGFLNNLAFEDFALSDARPEPDPDARLVGFLGDLVKRLPAQSVALFRWSIMSASSRYGSDLQLLAHLFAVGRRGWRDSDLHALMAALTNRHWTTLDIASLRHSIRAGLRQSSDGFWHFAHRVLRRSVAGLPSPVMTSDIQQVIVEHLGTLPADDPLRRGELVHHLLEVQQYARAASVLGIEDRDASVHTLWEEIVSRREADPDLDWLDRILRAEELSRTAQVRLAGRLEHDVLDELQRGGYTHAQLAVLKILHTFRKDELQRYRDKREPNYRLARLLARKGELEKDLGLTDAAFESLGEADKLTMLFIETASTLPIAARMDDPVGMDFSSPPTVNRCAEWLDLLIRCQSMLAEMLLAQDRHTDAAWILANLYGLLDNGPADVMNAIHESLPLRNKAEVGTVSAYTGLSNLYFGCGHAAYGQFYNAYSRLVTILSFIPKSSEFRRELAVVKGRMAQAVLRVGAAGAAIRLGVSASDGMHEVCQEDPSRRSWQVDLGYLTLWLGDALAANQQAGAAFACYARAARIIEKAVGTTPEDPSWRAALEEAHRRLSSATPHPDNCNIHVPEWDYERPEVWSSSLMQEAVRAMNPDDLARWRASVLHGPRFSQWTDAARLAQFAMLTLIEREGNDALTEVTMTYTDKEGREHEVRDLREDLSERFDIDGVALFAELQGAAERGDMNAQYRLGSAYLNSVFDAEGESLDEFWLRKAAEQGSPLAQHDLAVILQRREEDPDAWAESVRWYENAVEQGCQLSLSNLALAYLYGRGAPKNPARAFELMERDANLGAALSAYSLGVCFQQGLEVKRNPAKARHWYGIAVEQGNTSAMINLASMLMHGDGGAKDLGRARKLLERAIAQGKHYGLVLLARYHFQLAAKHDYKAAFDLFKQASAHSIVEGIHGVGVCLLYGRGVERDFDRAIDALKQSADAGFEMSSFMLSFLESAYRSWPVPKAMRRQLIDTLGWSDRDVQDLIKAAGAYRDHKRQWLGAAADTNDPRAFYDLGIHFAQLKTPPDYEKAAVYYRKAADQGVVEAAHDLASLYFNGQGVPKSVTEGLRWLRQAAEQGFSRSQYDLAVAYSEGVRVAPNEAEALYWYQRSADQGEPAALHNLAWLYLQGRGVKRDVAKAVDLLRRAAARGFNPSEQLLRHLEEEIATDFR